MLYLFIRDDESLVAPSRNEIDDFISDANIKKVFNRYFAEVDTEEFKRNCSFVILRGFVINMFEILYTTTDDKEIVRKFKEIDEVTANIVVPTRSGQSYI